MRNYETGNLFTFSLAIQTIAIISRRPDALFATMALIH
jgi:hypothetical protein